MGIRILGCAAGGWSARLPGLEYIRSRQLLRDTFSSTTFFDSYYRNYIMWRNSSYRQIFLVWWSFGTLFLSVTRGMSHSRQMQSITWTYANSLDRGASFFLEVLGSEEVTGLVQEDKCRIFRTTSLSAGFVGVCNTRKAPRCEEASAGDEVPVTITIVLPNRSSVDDFHAKIWPLNGTSLIVTDTSSSTAFAAYGFNFYDIDIEYGVGCYRFEVQSFDDPAWPPLEGNSSVNRLRDQLKIAGSQLQVADPPKVPISCACVDFCGGKCFAPSCVSCDPSIWSSEATCKDPGPLGQGLLCARDAESPCCSPNGETCKLSTGGSWCDCSEYPKSRPLFPPLESRVWSNATGCVEEKGSILGFK